MNKKLILPILGILGMMWAIRYVMIAAPKPVVAAPIAEPTNIPFTHYIAGSGLTEPYGGMVHIGTYVSGIVTAIPPKIGDIVTKGAPLFMIEDSMAKATLMEEQANLKNQQDQYDIINSIQDPRAVSVNESQSWCGFTYGAGTDGWYADV
jgi:HlyD family secretion protein